MNPTEYTTQFGDELRLCPNPPAELSEADSTFLSTIGLPHSAPGYLGFTIDRGIGSVAEQGWPTAIDGTHWYMIGHEGAGDPVVIDATTGHLLVLDHEQGFVKRSFLNSTLPQLASTLAVVSRVMRSDYKFDDEATYTALLREIAGIDFAATLADGFWPSELAMMLGDTIEPQWNEEG
jgi:hypothetical protein